MQGRNPVSAGVFVHASMRIFVRGAIWIKNNRNNAEKPQKTLYD
jgi:hypothetical protein